MIQKKLFRIETRTRELCVAADDINEAISNVKEYYEKEVLESYESFDINEIQSISVLDLKVII